jgi:hypothetical protein
MLSPGQGFALFVSWCTLLIIATALMIAFFPWSIPFWVGAIAAATYVAARVLGRLGSG